MKKLFLWILIFIQPLLIAIAAGLSSLLIFRSEYQGEVAIAFFLLVAITALIPGIVISIFIYKKHLSSKQFED